ncbi:hypothetical protein ACUXOC_001407 [Corynebacterium mucifaciens]|uniref:hypothetical protein n=1 Tax=Corynebacterium ureicelerivorans TaxID=401472 RepID=UPI00264E7508|nr:hypothetical protein [Corynebacterium ureicelerivorans]MDN8627146.1 hypothetical protein [Corynebacterium ureicelerivorans]
MKKTIALVGTVLASGALLAGCGQSGDFDGEWSGDITATQEGSGGGSATISIDGGDCEWQMTETDGETNEANCLRDDKEFKLEDPLTHQDLKYDAERSGDTLTLSPQNDQAEKVGVMVLTKTGDE